jgi:hypothetical protein
MKKFVLFAAILFTVSVCISQNGSSLRQDGSYAFGSSGGGNSNFDIFIRTIDINQKNLAFGLTEAEFDAIKDEAYANSNFVQGKIFQDDNLLRSNIPMRYNAYADEIEIKSHTSEKDYGALTKDPSIYVKMGNDIYVFIPYEGSNEKGGYFNILADGKTYDLYKKTTTVFQEPTKAKTSYQRDTPPSFNKTTKYYLVKNGIFFELPTSKAKLLKVMDSKKNEMKTYIGENNLDLDKEADLIKAVTYFDSLL